MEYKLLKIREKSIRNRKIFEKCAEQWEGGLVHHQTCFPGISGKVMDK
jgi:hypothetical protein